MTKENLERISNRMRNSCFLYCVAESNSEDAHPCKIGMSTYVKGRLISLQAGNWRKLHIIWTIQMPLDLAKDIEWHCLTRFRPSIYTGNQEDRLKSEWVDASAADIFAYARNYFDLAEVA